MPRSLISAAYRRLSLAFIVCATLDAIGGRASAALLWDWSYTGPGINVSGTFSTVDTPDSMGFFPITGITGTRNGETITGLHPVGTAIPGNEPLALTIWYVSERNNLPAMGLAIPLQAVITRIHFLLIFYRFRITSRCTPRLLSFPELTTSDRRTANWRFISRRARFLNLEVFFL